MNFMCAGPPTISDIRCSPVLLGGQPRAGWRTAATRVIASAEPGGNGLQVRRRWLVCLLPHYDRDLTSSLHLIDVSCHGDCVYWRGCDQSARIIRG